MLQAGIIGLGRIGIGFISDPNRGLASTHVGSYKLVDGVELISACDSNPAVLYQDCKELRLLNLYQDMAEMMWDGCGDLEIISICTPPDQHLACVQAAVAGGARAIFLEKPIADTYETGQHIVELCERKGVALLVDHQRRFSPLHRAASGYVLTGKMGRIQGGWAWYTAGLFNSGTHLINLLSLYLGNAYWVRGRPSVNPSWKEDDPNIDALVRFMSGPEITIHGFDHKHYADFGFTIWGTEGKLETTNNGMGLLYWEARESAVFSGYNELYPASLPVRGVKETDRLIPLGIEMLRDYLEEETPLDVSGRDALATLKVLEAIKLSATKGGVICLDPLEQSPGQATPS